MHTFIPHGLSNSVLQNVLITLRSSTTGQPLTGIAYGSVTITIIYDDDADSPVAITPVDGTLGSFVSSGWKETSKAGEYQFSIPNTHVATAGKRFKIRVDASGVITSNTRVVIYDGAKGLGDPTNIDHALSDLSNRTPDALVSGNLKARVMAMADNVITAAATDSGYITELAEAIEAAIANDADMTAVVQTIADRIAADWVAGDSSPLAIVAALKADAQWSNLATMQSNLTTILTRLVGTIAAGTHQPQGGDAHAIVSDGTHGNAALLTQLGTLATSAALALVKAVTDKLDTAMQLDGSVYRFTTNALEQAPSGGGGGNVSLTPVRSSLSPGEVRGEKLVTYYRQPRTFQFFPVDADGEAVEPDGTYRFVVAKKGTPETPLIEIEGIDDITATYISVALTGGEGGNTDLITDDGSGDVYLYLLHGESDQGIVATNVFHCREVPV